MVLCVENKDVGGGGVGEGGGRHPPKENHMAGGEGGAVQ